MVIPELAPLFSAPKILVEPAVQKLLLAKAAQYANDILRLSQAHDAEVSACLRAGILKAVSEHMGHPPTDADKPLVDSLAPGLHAYFRVEVNPEG